MCVCVCVMYKFIKEIRKYGMNRKIQIKSRLEDNFGNRNYLIRGQSDLETKRYEKQIEVTCTSRKSLTEKKSFEMLLTSGDCLVWKR